MFHRLWVRITSRDSVCRDSLFGSSCLRSSPAMIVVTMAFGLLSLMIAPSRACAQAKNDGKNKAAQASDDVTKQIESLKDRIKEAGQFLKDDKLVECAEAVEKSSGTLVELVKISPSKHWSDLKKLHAQLIKAQQLLEVQGAELTALPEWDELEKFDPKSMKENKGKTDPKGSDKPAPTSSTVSFTKDIAPWMVEQCGRCHITATRGGFSMESYSILMKGPKEGVVIFPGDAVGSRIVETIETGDMPRSGGKVSPENLAKLKQWIIEGAKYDGTDANGSLKTMAADGKPKEEPVVVKEATGKETVSFARDIAPILTENCNGCHFRGQRASGGLRFDNFSQLIKGGDSGNIIAPGKPDESLLVKKIKGMAGQRMPAGGRPALSETQINLISTWIKEGATFDGSNKETRLDQVAAAAWASKATHTELMAKRMQRARDQWKIVAPKAPADEANDDEFHVVGNIGSESAKHLLGQVNSAASQVRKMFKLNSKDPLVKGGITVYALKQRYDYSEFGTMLESRSLPSEWSGHWRREVLDAYIAIVYDKSDDKINESTLVQHLTSLWIASHDGVPQWFADGAGRQAMAISVGPADARVQPWLRRMPESMNQLKNLKPFLDGAMNEEDSATIGFGIIRYFYENNGRKQYDAVLRNLESGMKFDKAFEKAVGPLDIFLQQLLGKKK